MLKESYTHPYTGYHGFPAHCHIRIYDHNQKTIVVATELEDNTGTSITNMAEYIATDIWVDLGRPPLERFMWIEHYPERGIIAGRPTIKEDFDMVTFEQTTWKFGEPDHQADYPQVLREPKWKHITKDELERLIGEPWIPVEV
jgi:hypothetical protein